MLKLLSPARFAVLSLAVVCCSVGCSKEENVTTGEVDGVVSIDGQMLTSGAVAFYDAKSGVAGGAPLDESGKFKLESPLPVGSYQVSFTPPDAPQPDDEQAGKMAKADKSIPIGYRDSTSSGIVCEVKEGPNSFDFKLSKKGPGR